MPVAAILDSTGAAVIAAISLAFGYLLLWAMWHFVFSPRNEHDDVRDRARSEHDGDRRV